MATHSSILAWRISWTEEPGGLQAMGSQRVGHGRVTEHTQHYVCASVLNFKMTVMLGTTREAEETPGSASLSWIVCARGSGTQKYTLPFIHVKTTQGPIHTHPQKPMHTWHGSSSHKCRDTFLCPNELCKGGCC